MSNSAEERRDAGKSTEITGYVNSYLSYRDLAGFKETRKEVKVEFEEGEQGEATWFNKHHGLGSFPFSSLIFLAFVGSLVSAVVARRDTEPSQPIAPRLRYGILARVGGRVRAQRRGW